MIGSHARHDVRARVVEAALSLLGRDGGEKLDSVALARISGLPQSRIVQLFSSRESVMLAVLLNVVACLMEVGKLNDADAAAGSDRSRVAGQLALCREISLLPQKTLLSLLQFAAGDDGILEFASASEKHATARVIDQSPHPEMDLIRLYAGRGLAISNALGMCPLSPAERDALLERLSDDSRWSGRAHPNTQAPQ